MILFYFIFLNNETVICLERMRYHFLRISAALLWHWVYFSPDRSLYISELVNCSLKEQRNQDAYESSLCAMFMYPTFCKMSDVILIPAVNTALPGLYLLNKCGGLR